MDQAEFDKKALDLSCKVVHKRHSPLFLYMFHREAELAGKVDDLDGRLAYLNNVVTAIYELIEKDKRPYHNTYKNIKLTTTGVDERSDGEVKVETLASMLGGSFDTKTIVVKMCPCHGVNHWGSIGIED